MPRVHLKTFGCQMNEYDSARMADVLRECGGYEATENPEEADLLLLNTCSVREKAQEKVFSQLGRWRDLKAARPHVIIGVGGCVASQEGEGITARAPFVDLVFGPQTIHRLPDMLAQLRKQGRSVVDISFPETEKVDRRPPPRAEPATARWQGAAWRTLPRSFTSSRQCRASNESVSPPRTRSNSATA